MKKYGKYFVLIIIISTAYTQKLPPSGLYMPLDIKQVYETDTRSLDGRPGSGYWQNHSDYKIEAEIIPEKRLLIGEEEITYYNNSPDTLHQIYIRLYQDIYKKGNMRDWPITPFDVHDGVKIKELEIDGDEVDLETMNSPVQRKASLMVIDLSEPLTPSSKIEIRIEWEFTITLKTNIRMGAYDSTTFFIAYWYPQISVYDDLDGWDVFNYGGLQEFYNDHSNFDVTITMPENFIVWATGELQNADDVLEDEYFERYEAAGKSNNIINIITASDLGKEITDDNDWHFKAEGVPDFSFGTSDHYLWDCTSLVVDPQNKRRVRIAAAFNQSSKDFYEVADIARESIRFFSKVMPGWPYPYPEMTIFNGQGGMESPMMVNDGSSSRKSGTVHLTSHEIAHTYFPFFMGTNEKKYAWMDEGWAVMLPYDLQAALAPGYDPIARNARTYSRTAGLELEIPLMIPSIIASGNVYRPTYRVAAYNRPAAAYHILYQTLGDSLFKAALHEYIARWNHKHPIPYDFFFTFDEVMGERLDWFWKPWFFESGYPDLAIRDVFFENETGQILIENSGTMPVPVKITVLYQDDSEFVLEKSAAVWKNKIRRLTLTIDHSKPIKKIILGGVHIPDVNEDNNEFELNENK